MMWNKLCEMFVIVTKWFIHLTAQGISQGDEHVLQFAVYTAAFKRDGVLTRSRPAAYSQQNFEVSCSATNSNLDSTL